MLHLTVTASADVADDVLALLRASDVVSGIVHQRGVAERPDGDVVEADLPREAADAIVHALVERGVHDDGIVRIEPVETWVSRRGHDDERRAPGDASDAVVWAQVVQRSYEDSRITGSYLAFFVLATGIAAVAIVLDSQILTIGAMVLGPEFGAVAALGVALVGRRPNLLGMAARSLAVGFAIAIAVTTALALLARLVGWIRVEDIAVREETAFIYRPDQWSVVVALVAAAAGIIAIASSRSGGLSGVFISVTTIPAAGNIALALAFGVWDEVLGSAAQLLVNVAAMALAGWLTLLVIRARRSRAVARS
ncbi:DUF389 domain-containing protein [Agrococcus sp. SGAir0287]|uniref:DUF389 domain-containing protein n=1 Tax=Agrococcus sp. SGAir0287 TaxID=2070347 RepID=UPI0010CD5498|nr:DUF389 domain-containing protein [Agrococcus sp. SGAir0287]QCR19533.1 DUF389 domain-containing protein [Agrococcus sp. SGAir0287]